MTSLAGRIYKTKYSFLNKKLCTIHYNKHILCNNKLGFTLPHFPISGLFIPPFFTLTHIFRCLLALPEASNSVILPLLGYSVPFVPHVGITFVNCTIYGKGLTMSCPITLPLGLGYFPNPFHERLCFSVRYNIDQLYPIMSS